MNKKHLLGIFFICFGIAGSLIMIILQRGDILTKNEPWQNWLSGIILFILAGVFFSKIESLKEILSPGLQCIIIGMLIGGALGSIIISAPSNFFYFVFVAYSVGALLGIKSNRNIIFANTK